MAGFRARLRSRFLTAGFFRPGPFLQTRLKYAPQFHLNEINEGQFGRVHGRVTALDAADTLTSPIGGRACVYYGVALQRLKLVGWGNTEREVWDTVANEVRDIPFVIDDRTGHAVVVCTDAEILWPWYSLGVLRPGDTPDERQAALLAHFGKRWGHSVSHHYNFLERLIPVGATIAVYGAGTLEADPDAEPEDNYRGAARTRLRLTSSKKHPLAIIDGISAGISPIPVLR